MDGRTTPIDGGERPSLPTKRTWTFVMLIPSRRSTPRMMPSTCRRDSTGHATNGRSRLHRPIDGSGCARLPRPRQAALTMLGIADSADFACFFFSCSSSHASRYDCAGTNRQSGTHVHASRDALGVRSRWVQRLRRRRAHLCRLGRLRRLRLGLLRGLLGAQQQVDAVEVQVDAGRRERPPRCIERDLADVTAEHAEGRVREHQVEPVRIEPEVGHLEVAIPHLSAGRGRSCRDGVVRYRSTMLAMQVAGVLRTLSCRLSSSIPSRMWPNTFLRSCGRHGSARRRVSRDQQALSDKRACTSAKLRSSSDGIVRRLLRRRPCEERSSRLGAARCGGGSGERSYPLTESDRAIVRAR
eukprot:2733687-Prymnesium_polylepis.1